jgi:hypothetical protein
MEELDGRWKVGYYAEAGDFEARFPKDTIEEGNNHTGYIPKYIKIEYDSKSAFYKVTKKAGGGWKILIKNEDFRDNLPKSIITPANEFRYLRHVAWKDTEQFLATIGFICAFVGFVVNAACDGGKLCVTTEGCSPLFTIEPSTWFILKITSYLLLGFGSYYVYKKGLFAVK